MTANELYAKGARIWIPDPEAIWRGAELLEDYTGQAQVKVQYEEGEESVLKIKDKNNLPHLRNPEILIGENDLTSLSYLNEPEVLYNLQVRFLEQNLIYTYCGIVLVAINPYADLPIYGNEIIQAYSGQDMGAMDPHIFAVAEEAYKKMARFEQNQSIIVSGESGAGKTVSAKYAMRYFATVGGSQAETQVERRVLASNPIMEAIGNAKTTRNDNSSRFGKYIEISFNKKNEIVGAHMRTYLLEKSRVVYQATDERNYHIFYQLCASSDLPEFKKFQLLSADDFYYTSHGEDPIINGVDDAEVLCDTREALDMLGISSKDQMMIFQILSAILHFGNVRIKEAEGETSEIPAKDKSLILMCQLLGIEESQMRMWLCNRKFTTVGEVLTKPLTSEQASNAQDALAKHIYAKMFDWIVDKVNISLHSSSKQHKFIGVLDIYGFETFQINSFEQFCINYANEKLQQIFNMHVFKLEQEEYVREGIAWSFIDFYDNQPCIDLIESKLGILDLLDEECKMPKGSDKNWCQKLYDKHYNKSKHFDKPRMSNMAFIIHHFADKVEYQADGFLEKNRDTVLEDHINILRASEFELVAELFENKPDPNEKKQRAGSHPTQPLRSNPKGKNMKKTVGTQQETKATVGDQFRDSLFKLMDTLNATTPHYIRCIKPNDIKEAFEFDPRRAVEQLRACGVLETIRISAAGYPSRWTYSEFFQRYRVLARSKDINRSNTKKTCENILISIIQGASPTKHRKNQQPTEDPDKYRFGKTKIFFRAGQVAYLEKLRSDKLRYCGIMIQKHVKGWLQRKRYRKITKSVCLLQKYGRGLLARRYARFLRETWAAKTIQKRWRGYQVRRHYTSVRKAVIILQASIRGFFGRREFERTLHAHRAVIIQRYARGWLARVRYRRVIKGIVKLQSHFRRRRAKKELKKLKIEAKSVDHIKNVNKGLENKIIQLQQQLDSKNKEILSVKQHEVEVDKMKTELEKLRGSSGEAEKSSNKITELLAQIKTLRLELEKEQIEKQDLISEKELLKKDRAEIANKLTEENTRLSTALELAKTELQEQEKDLAEMIKAKVDAANKQLMAEFESERSHHQRLVKEHSRLQQRLENLQGEMEYLSSPQGHKRTPSDMSAISLESYTSSVSPDEKKEAEEENEKEDQGYGTEKSKKKKKAPAPPVPVGGEFKDIDIGLLLKLQNRVKDLEKEKSEMQKQIENSEEDVQKAPTSKDEVISDSAFNALKKQLVNAEDVQLVIKLQKRVKDLELTKSRLRSELDDRDDDDDELSKFNITTPEFAYNNLKMQELENENDKLKREVRKLMKAISDSTNFDQTDLSPSGKEFMDQFEAMNDELERRREECLQLRAMMAEKSITTHAIAKESYGGNDNIVNEDNELSMAYRTQKELNRQGQDYVDTEDDVRSKGQMSKMGTSASSCDKQPEDDDDQSLNSDYSTSHSMIWNNKKFTPLLGGSTISVEYLDLVNETSGFWTFDESVNTRVSHVLSASDEIENNLCSLDSGLNDSNVTDGTLKYYVEENETSDKNNGNENNLIDKDCEKGIIDYANINKRFLVDEGHITETLNEDDRQIFDSGCSGSSVNENPVLEENDMLSENPITVSGQNNENLYTNDKENVILIDTGCQKSELQGIDNIAADLVEDDLTGAVNVVADINLENKANNINIETRADEPKEDDTVNNLTSENNEPKDDTVNNLTSENNEPKEYIVNNLTSESNESKDDIVNNLTSENNESKDDTVDNLTSENNESKDDTVDNLTSENNESKDDTVDNLTCENNESKDDTVDNLTSESNEPKDDTVDNFSGNTEDYFTEENSGSFSSENYRNENNSYKPLFISDSNVSGKMKDLINECIESKTVESAVVVKGGNLHLKTDENCNSQYLLNISDINNEKSCRKKPDILENTKTRTTEEFELSEKQKMTNKVCHFKNKNRKKDLCHGNCDVIKSIDTDDLTQYQENPNGSGDNNDCLKYDNSDSVSMCSERSDTLFDSGDNNISNHDIFDSGDSNISNHDIFDNGDSNISNHDTFDNGDSNISNHDIFDSGDSNISNHDIYDNGDNNISNHDVHSVVSNDRCLNHGLASNNLNQYLISNPLSNNDYINVIKDTESNTKLNNNSRDYKEEVTCSENNKCQDLGCNHLNHIHNSCSNNSSQREDNILEYRIEDNVQTYRPGDLDNRNDVNHDQECNHYYHEHDSSDNKNDVNHDQEYNHYYHEHDSGDKTIDLCQNLEIDNLTCQYEEETKLEDTVTTVNCEKSLSHGKLSTAKCVQGHVIKSCDCNNPINCIHLCKNINQLSIENNDNLSINQDGVLQKHSTDKVLQLCSVSLSVDNNKMVDKHLSNVEPRLQSFQSAEEEVFENKHISDSDDENLSAEDVAYLTCSDDEPDDQCTAESFMKHSQPESGFGETLASNFTTTEKDDFECGLSDKFENFDEPLHEESFEDDDNYYHHRNHLNDDPADNEWGDGTLCGCYECLGRLQIERIVTADKCTMFPDEPPYILTCDICEELLENQLQKTEKDSKKKEADLKKQLKSLKEENEKQHKVIQQNLQLGPEAKIEATMQHEITRLTSENLDLRESLDKNQDKISKLKKMLKVYAKRLKDGEAAEIAAELDKEDTESNVGNVATIKHRERNYMGMLEYRKEDEGVLIKNLIMDLKPRVAVGLLPGLPAYVLFMCVRHTDYVNDDEKVRSLLTNTINGIKKCVKKYHNDLERVMMWFANTCRLLHTLKQYSGEKAFQPDNTARQNEHCLRNFDLSEYRQVFSDLAVWIYQTLIRQMQDTVQQMIVPAVLEHEAIAGLTASKPSGMRGRSSSNAMELEDKELSLDSLMKAMNKFSQILAQHAVDPELIKQIFRQLYYFVCSGALNNLLLRKDMCNWSKGMQIRYNLSHLEQWLRDNKLQESGALTELEPITQASQLLQARKTEADVDSICEMCSQLTTPQIVKILNLYTPVDEFEERVPISFIRKIQHKLKGRQEADNTLLMDTKHSFPVTFPFNPSSIAMETIEVPQQLHLGFLNRH